MLEQYYIQYDLNVSNKVNACPQQLVCRLAVASVRKNQLRTRV